MKFDHAKFFAGYRNTWGSLEQDQVDGLDFLLTSFEAWPDLRQTAYALATIKHETANTFQPITEHGQRSYFNKYEHRTDLGNTAAGDGYLYRGRGYVQITGRRNYTYFGIEHTPEDALKPATAFRIMTIGMTQGRFTGKKLSDYISDTGVDYYNARKIINGHDKAELIAGYAKSFEQILRDSKVSASQTATQDSPSDSNVEQQQPAVNETPTEQPVVKQETVATDSTITTTTETKGDDPSVPPTQVSKNGLLAKLLTGGGVSASIGGAILTYITGHLDGVAIFGICITALLLALLFRGTIVDVIRMQAASDPDKRNVT